MPRERTAEEQLDYIMESCRALMETPGFDRQTPVSLGLLSAWIGRSKYERERKAPWICDYKHPPDRMVAARKLARAIIDFVEQGEESTPEGWIALARDILGKENPSDEAAHSNDPSSRDAEPTDRL